MIIALNNVRQRILAIHATKQQRYFCPVCLKPVILKKGLKYSAHFAHQSNKSHHCYANESVNHYHAKLLLAQYFSRLGYYVEIEPHLKNIRQVPDLIINKTNVIELQFSTIPYTDIISRTRGLERLGYKVRWIVKDSDMINEKVKLSRFLASFIQPHSRTMFTFNSSEKTFYLLSHMQHIGGRMFCCEKHSILPHNIFQDVPTASIIPYKLSSTCIHKYLRRCRRQNSVLQPTLSAMYQLRFTDYDVTENFGYIFPQQLFIETHPIEWQLNWHLLAKQGQLTPNDISSIFKFRKLIYHNYCKNDIIEQCRQSYLDIINQRCKNVQILH